MSEMPPNRVIEPDRGSLSVRQETVIGRLIAKRGKLFTPYKIWVHSAGVAEGMELLGTHLNTGSSLSKAELELVVLATAVHWGSPFVIKAHTRHARAAGLPEALVSGLLDREPLTPEEPRLAAIAGLTADALLAGGAVDDATFARYEAALGREGIAEVIALIGYYTAVAIAMRLHNVQPKAD